MMWIEANGASLRYELCGAGGRTVVLLHEAGGSLESWDAVAMLLQSRYRVLRYDQRGFGMSESTTSLSLAGMVEDLRALLDALPMNNDPVCLVGTAIGASLAIAFAATHPSRVSHVVAASPVTGDLSAAAVDSLELRAQVVERNGMRAIADASLARSFPERLRHDTGAFLQYRGRLLANDPRGFAALSRAYAGVNLAPLYPQVACPALIVGCRDDDIKPSRECAAAAAALPRGRFVEAASGHFIAVQSPGLFARMIEDFLETPQ
jgi:3-oxoadipate enol-lactonase